MKEVLRLVKFQSPFVGRVKEKCYRQYMLLCTMPKSPIDGQLTLAQWFDQVIHAPRCGAPAVFKMRFGAYCAVCAKRIVRTTLLGENMIGQQLYAAGRMPRSIEEAEKLWLKPLN